MLIRNCKPVCIFIIAALAGIGCGGKPVGIKGKVTLDGAPVAGASVEFVPEDGGRPAVGTTDKDGKFSLSTYKPGDGAMRGEYRVVIKRTPERALPQPDMKDKEAVKKLMMQSITANQNFRAQAGSKDAIPGDYGEPFKTPLRQTVPDSKGNYNQELTSKQGDHRAAR